MPPPQVVVIGDALLDVQVHPSEPMRPGSDVPAAIRLGQGGQGANVAVRLARRGVRVRLACALGDDEAGRIVREALDAERIEVDAAPAKATGGVVILVAGDGERTMLSHRVPLLPRTVGAAPMTVVSGYLLLEDGELQVDGEEKVALLGCAVADEAVQRWWRRARNLDPDVVIVNADELRALRADASALAMESGALVVVTGPERIDVTRGDPDAAPLHVDVDRVAAVDSTGAGDAFAAAFLAELHDRPTWDEVELRRALVAGHDLAAQVAGVAGAQARVPSEGTA